MESDTKTTTTTKTQKNKTKQNTATPPSTCSSVVFDPCYAVLAGDLGEPTEVPWFLTPVTLCWQVIWVNPRKILISHMDRRTIDDHRISVERPYIKEWNLLIREVRYNDSGTYECRINTKPKQIKKVTLSVQGAGRTVTVVKIVFVYDKLSLNRMRAH